MPAEKPRENDRRRERRRKAVPLGTGCHAPAHKEGHPFGPKRSYRRGTWDAWARCVAARVRVPDMNVGKGPMSQNTLKETVSSMKNGRGAELLAALGLERQRSPIAVTGPLAVILVAGVILSAAVALWMAPQSGHVLRRRVKKEANQLLERISKKPRKAVSELRSAPSTEEDALAA